MRRVLLAIAAIVILACAGRTAPGAGSSDSCDASVDPTPIYPAYSVTERASPIPSTKRGGGISIGRRPSAGEDYSATIRFVIDTMGRVERCGAEVVRENPRGFGATLIRSMRSARFTPATRLGEKVRMLAVFELRIQVSEDSIAAHSTWR
jgi:hypothetical protein